MSLAAEPFWGKGGLLRVGQPERFGVVGRPWAGCRRRCTISQGLEGSGACAQGVVQSPAWQALLQEGWPVASRPVLQEVPRPVSPPLPVAALLSSLGMSGSLYMKGKRPACAFNPPGERHAGA